MGWAWAGKLAPDRARTMRSRGSASGSARVAVLGACIAERQIGGRMSARRATLGVAEQGRCVAEYVAVLEMIGRSAIGDLTTDEAVSMSSYCTPPRGSRFSGCGARCDSDANK